ncbi:MAG: plastocyanin/azurin family copper-binding protein [Acidimicrobiia bacterium]|nr:plastocyanin/azurin family copper-binding protein [Acidimicrobiia bacterium]
MSEADAVPEADTDAAVPADLATEVGGAPGFTRYVFRSYEGEVIPSLVEGPQGEQARCHDPELPCSYLDLKELAESGDDIPEGLELTPDELDELVAQLDTLNAKVDEYRDVNKACADGYSSDRTQTPNMGSHFYNGEAILDGEADPAFPDILLYARADGEAPGGALGQCRDGEWDGDEVEMVGTSYLLPQDVVGDDHPEGFAGDLDNWHIHYNLCRGLGQDSIVPREVCEEKGGQYRSTLGWMIHVWADDQHDNQLGVFGMWNPTIWPISDADDIVSAREVRPPQLAPDEEYSPISNFGFGEPIEIEAGDKVVFGNSDSVPHTVTGTGDKAFDSGVFAPGSTFEQTFEEPGEYSYFCVLHPDMQGKIVVE